MLTQQRLVGNMLRKSKLFLIEVSQKQEQFYKS